MNMYCYFWMLLFIMLCYTCMQRNLINSNSNSKIQIRVEVFGYAQSTVTVVAGKQGQCNRQWTNAYKTHFSDNKVKCLERQIELKMVSKIKKIHDGIGAEISVPICYKLVLPCNTDKCM